MVAIVVLCTTALIGFAANSLLCRAALGPRTIDAASFTAIRLGAGAAILLALVAAASRTARARAASATGHRVGRGSWGSAIALVAYAAAFSFAYLRLTAATGALILFGTVQIAMIGWGVARGERPRALEWLGSTLAIGGLIALTLPGLAAPDPLGAVLMAIAGGAWGVYSIRGRGAAHPLAVTADNFARSLPFAIVLVVAATLVDGHVSVRGALLAVASGALASGLGYSLWYAALPHLTATRAAIVQLAVPVLAAGGGALLLGEPITTRFVVCATAILGGVALAVRRVRTSGQKPAR